MKATLTERGQVSMPAALRRQMHLKAGQPMIWEKISNDECRIRILRKGGDKEVQSMRGFMKRFQTGNPALPETTAGWMKLLREGEGK